ncbi:TIGR04282 family arsenosugar biosynthesis glycosyltransferase [Rhodanobacter thiooxydans]|nr:TIGR04282 family arsenosugar biosynthesis glycosyltransferase [Rhodanobacter thiooxydans]MCW0202075.1 TIGR04282 family arsenosugar biosynthesis glycosyltransferase [Rhodanobacter thiooxydans]
MTTALAIFVKTPGHSPLKTRLAAAIGEDAALDFHRLASAAVAAVAKATRPLITPYWAVAEADDAAHAAWPDFPTIWQGEGGLGTRMHHVLETLLGRHDSVLLVGADVPQLTSGQLAQAAQALAEPPVACVLGPATDGGFWLFGANTPVPLATWQSVRYSRGDTCLALRKALPATENIVELPVLTDVDNADDLPRVLDALGRLPEALPAQRALAKWMQRQLAGSPTA